MIETKIPPPIAAHETMRRTVSQLSSPLMKKRQAMALITNQMSAVRAAERPSTASWSVRNRSIPGPNATTSTATLSGS